MILRSWSRGGWGCWETVWSALASWATRAPSTGTSEAKWSTWSGSRTCWTGGSLWVSRSVWRACWLMKWRSAGLCLLLHPVRKMFSVLMWRSNLYHSPGLHCVYTFQYGRLEFQHRSERHHSFPLCCVAGGDQRACLQMISLFRTVFSPLGPAASPCVSTPSSKPWTGSRRRRRRTIWRCHLVWSFSKIPALHFFTSCRSGASTYFYPFRKTTFENRTIKFSSNPLGKSMWFKRITTIIVHKLFVLKSVSTCF